jgi:hypothetical protein
MSPLWKPQNGFHSGLEISHRTRDSHISTADHRHEDRRTTEGGLDSDDGFGHAQRAVRRGNSGRKGFENPGSIPSENRQRWNIASAFSARDVCELCERCRVSLRGIPGVLREISACSARDRPKTSRVSLRETHQKDVGHSLRETDGTCFRVFCARCLRSSARCRVSSPREPRAALREICGLLCARST